MIIWLRQYFVGGGGYLPITASQGTTIISGGLVRNGRMVTLTVKFKRNDTGGDTTFIFSETNFYIGDINYPLTLTNTIGQKVDGKPRWWNNSAVLGATITANTEYIISGSFVIP